MRNLRQYVAVRSRTVLIINTFEIARRCGNGLYIRYILRNDDQNVYCYSKTTWENYSLRNGMKTSCMVYSFTPYELKTPRDYDIFGGVKKEVCNYKRCMECISWTKEKFFI